MVNVNVSSHYVVFAALCGVLFSSTAYFTSPPSSSSSSMAQQRSSLERANEQVLKSRFRPSSSAEELTLVQKPMGEFAPFESSPTGVKPRRGTHPKGGPQHGGAAVRAPQGPEEQQGGVVQIPIAATPIENPAKTEAMGSDESKMTNIQVVESDWASEYISAGRRYVPRFWSNGTDPTQGPEVKTVSRPPGEECSDNAKCRASEGCVADELGVCYKPDFNSNSFVYEPRPRPGQRIPTGGTSTKQLECAWMPEHADPLPTLNLTDTSPRGTLANFKFLSGVSFQKWFDWEAEIKYVTEPTEGEGSRRDSQSLKERRRGRQPDPSPRYRSSEFQTEGSHQGHHQLYTLNNFCISLLGDLSGFWPEEVQAAPVTTFHGGNDMSSAVKLVQGTEFRHTATTFVRQTTVRTYWLRTMANLNVSKSEREKTFTAGNVSESTPDELTVTTVDKKAKGRRSRTFVLPPKGARWYVDRKIYLMPVVKDHNDAHVGMRATSMIYNVDDGFPPTTSSGNDETSSDEHSDVVLGSPSQARSDVTTMYYPLEGLASYNTSLKPRFLGLATTTHAALFHRATIGDLWEHLRRSVPNLISTPKDRVLLERMLITPVCFKQAVMQQNCLDEDCYSLKPTTRSSFTLGGWRNPNTTQRIARRFRACAAVEYLADRRRDPSAPTVHIGVRSGPRRMFSLPTLIGRVRQWLDESISPRSRLLVAEMGRMNLVQCISLFSQVDIILSGYTTTFFLAFLASQPGAIGIELSWAKMHYAIAPTGINRFPRSDYGSLYEAIRGIQFSIQDSTSFSRTSPSVSFVTPPRLLEAALISSVQIQKRVAVGLDKLGAGAAAVSKAPQHELFSNLTLEELVDVRHIQTDFEFSGKQVEAAEDEFARDPSGSVFRRVIRSQLSDQIVHASPRLVELYNKAGSAEFRTVFPPLLIDGGRTLPNSAGKYTLSAGILLVFDCRRLQQEPRVPTSPKCWPSPESAVLTEIRALREYLSRLVTVTVFISHLKECTAQEEEPRKSEGREASSIASLPKVLRESCKVEFMSRGDATTLAVCQSERNLTSCLAERPWELIIADKSSGVQSENLQAGNVSHLVELSYPRRTSVRKC